MSHMTVGHFATIELEAFELVRILWAALVYFGGALWKPFGSHAHPSGVLFAPLWMGPRVRAKDS